MSCCTASDTEFTSQGKYAYRTAVNAVINPEGCADGGLNLRSSYYGVSRRTVSDPVVFHRSWVNSGCAPTALEDNAIGYEMPKVCQSTGTPQTLWTSKYLQSYPSLTEVDRSAQPLFTGTDWTSGYAGLSAVGGNISTRIVEQCHLEDKYNNHSACKSYGSYVRS